MKVYECKTERELRIWRETTLSLFSFDKKRYRAEWEAYRDSVENQFDAYLDALYQQAYAEASFTC